VICRFKRLTHVYLLVFELPTPRNFAACDCYVITPFFGALMLVFFPECKENIAITPKLVWVLQVIKTLRDFLTGLTTQGIKHSENLIFAYFLETLCTLRCVLSWHFKIQNPRRFQHVVFILFLGRVLPVATAAFKIYELSFTLFFHVVLHLIIPPALLKPGLRSSRD